MRKQNKIVSLVLVLALLLGVFVVVPSPVKASAADESTPFTPTATWTEQGTTYDSTNGYYNVVASAEYKSASTSSESGNKVSLGNIAKMDDFKLYTVNDGSNSYAAIVPSHTGTAAFDMQHTFNGSGSKFTDEAGNYYVVSLDIASESAFPADMYIQVTIRNGDWAKTDSFSDSINLATSLPELADGKWHNITLIGEMHDSTDDGVYNPKLYVYVDGVLDDSFNLKAMRAQSSTTDGNGNHTYTFSGVKVSNSKSTNAIDTNNSLMLDNVYGNYYTGMSGIQNEWIGIGGTNSGSLPALAEVNGTEYSNVNAASVALSSPFGSAEAELLRQYAGTITVNCDATVETNGVKGTIVAGTDVTSSADGTVYTYDAPFVSSATSVDISADSNNERSQVTAATSVGGGSYAGSANYTDATVKPYLVTDNVTGNQYFEVRPGASYNTADTTHNHFNWNGSNVYYVLGTYFVLEFDVYAESEIMKDLYFNVTSRSSAGNKGSSLGHLKDWGVPAGEWAHITIVGYTTTNVAHIYVNGERTVTKSNGLCAEAITTSHYFQGIRVNVAGQSNLAADQSVALDNFSYKTNVSNDSWLSANFGAASLEGWSGNSYTLPAVPVLATVDGEKVHTPAELSAALTGNGTKNVVLYRDYMGTVTVNSDATIETNGFTAPVAGTDVDVSNDGTLYTFDAPYQPSSYFNETKDSNDIMNAIKLDVEGNVWNSFSPIGINGLDDGHNGTKPVVQGATMGVTTNNVDGNTYVDMKPGTSGANSYLTLSPVQGGGVSVVKGATNQYYVLDMDLAFYGQISTNFGWYAVCRGSSGCFGNNINLAGGFNDMINGLEKGEFHHFTTVLDFDNNKILLFVNGVLVGGCTNGVYGSSGASQYAAGFKFEQFRLFSSNVDNFAVDNVAIRAVSDVNEMASVIAAGSLDSWSMNLQGTYDAGKLAPIAIVDGEYVTSSAKLNAALNGRYAKKVEILANFTDTITVNCDATVETNGLSVNLVAGANVNVSTSGTVKTFDAPWKASATETAAANGNFIIDSTVTDNLFTGRSGIIYVNNGSGKMTMYQVTDVNTGNTYLKLQPTVDDVTGANIYLTTEIIPASSSTSDACVLQDGVGYYVYDLDIAADAEIIKNMTITPSARNQASEGGTFPFPDGIALSNYQFSDGEWMHMTIVGDMAANVQYVFINGVLAGTAGKANQKAGEYSYLNVKGYRMNLNDKVTIAKNESIFLDNLSARVYKTVDASNGLDAAIAAGSLAGWSNNVTTENGKLPSIAIVDGVEYSSASAIEAALAGGSAHEISLDRAYLGTLSASSTGTIVTNGLANFILGSEGYNVTDNGDGTYTIAVETRMGSITVNINGVAAIKANVLYGTDIAEYLKKNNTYLYTYLSADNGQVYENVVWNTTPAGVVDGDEVYNVTADATTAKENIVLRADGTVYTTDATLKGILEDSVQDYTVILTADAELPSQIGPVRNNKTVYMAGRTLTFSADGAAVHAITLNSSSKTLKFVNGNIVDNVRSNTQAVFYFNADCPGTVELDNVNVCAVANLATVRSGNLVIKNSRINMLECQNSQGIQLCEYYNASYTMYPSSVSIIDSDVQFTHFSGDRSNAFISTTDFSAWNVDGSHATHGATYNTAIANGADKLQHSINISGSTFHVGFGASIIDNKNKNCTVSNSDSQLNVKSLIKSNSGTIVIGEGVYSSVSLGGFQLADGVNEVKTSNTAAAYLYTAYYATVIWSDGTVEKWEDGSYPVNNAVEDVVSKVEAGKTYNFVAGNAELSMKLNLSLDTNLKLNVFVPTASALTALNIGGVEFDVAGATVVKIGGVDYNQFAYEIAPYYAAGDIAIAATVNGETFARSINLVDYADKVAAAYGDDATAVNLVKAVLKYAAAASKTVGAYLANYDETNNYADAPAITTPTSGVNTMSAVNGYLASASLDLSSAPKWALKVVDGADLSTLVITVAGEQVEYTVENGYVYVELPAYLMLETITVSVGGQSGQYNLDAYYAYMVELAGTIFVDGTAAGNYWQAKANIAGAEAYYYVNGILPAFYDYVTYAAAYKA